MGSRVERPSIGKSNLNRELGSASDVDVGADAGLRERPGTSTEVAGTRDVAFQGLAVFLVRESERTVLCCPCKPFDEMVTEGNAR